MSHLKTSLNNFLNTKKFTRKDKRSISRNNSERSLDNIKNSFNNKKIHQESPKRTHKYENEQQDDYYESKQPVIRRIHSIEEDYDYQPSHRKQLIKSKREESDEEQYQQQSVRNKFQNQSENFQSSKRQAKLFVQSLSRKINLEIGKINNTIEEFNKNLRRTIDMEYSKLRAAIKNAVESVFEGQQDNIKKLAKMEQKSVNQQLSEIRAQLESMYTQLERYKDQLDGPNWKKTTGLLLSGDIELNVNELIKRSDKMKSIKNFKMIFDPKKQQAFGMALQQLLQVSLSGGLQNSRVNMGLVM